MFVCRITVLSPYKLRVKARAIGCLIGYGDVLRGACSLVDTVGPMLINIADGSRCFRCYVGGVEWCAKPYPISFAGSKFWQLPNLIQPRDTNPKLTAKCGNFHNSPNMEKDILATCHMVAKPTNRHNGRVEVITHVPSRLLHPTTRNTPC